MELVFSVQTENETTPSAAVRVQEASGSNPDTPTKSEKPTFQVGFLIFYNEVISMINISHWMDTFIRKLDNQFGSRVWFVGLQGSYGRGEATQTSDIDMVVILDFLSPSDILVYRDMLDTLPHRELICGFLSGRDELLNWETSDLFQFCHDTTPIIGSLDSVLAAVDDAAVTRAIKIGACNIYHGCVHNMLHEKSEDILRGLYKSAVFVVQAIVYQQTGEYVQYLHELKNAASPLEQGVVDTFIQIKRSRTPNFSTASETLFLWAKKWIQET